MDIVIIFGYDDGCLSTLIIHFGMKSRIFWYICFSSIETLSLFHKYVMNYNHQRDSDIILLNWL